MVVEEDMDGAVERLAVVEDVRVELRKVVEEKVVLEELREVEVVRVEVWLDQARMEQVRVYKREMESRWWWWKW